jgi:hypothetical protein
MKVIRMVVQTATKNAASYLVAGALRMFDGPRAFVSYADSSQGHCGIVYQATNWIYTGATRSHDSAYIVDGARVMPLTLRQKGVKGPKRWAKENGIVTIKPEPKHRYFILIGSRSHKKRMRAMLKYHEVTPYPKSEQRRYDAGPTLFYTEEQAAF